MSKIGFNVAIDGPAGAGKSTIAKKVAAKLNFIYVDTGAMYRAMAFNCIKKEIDLKNQEAVVEACKDVKITIEYVDGEQQVLLDGENVSGLIRTQQVGNGASIVSAYGPIREKLVSLQQEMARVSNVVMDGRDIGTCVLKDAQVKIYLTASSAVRAERRYKELIEKGMEADLATIEKEIIERDHNDMNRAISPLRQAEDAILLDSSDMDIEQVVSKMIEIIESKRGL